MRQQHQIGFPIYKKYKLSTLKRRFENKPTQNLCKHANVSSHTHRIMWVRHRVKGSNRHRKLIQDKEICIIFGFDQSAQQLLCWGPGWGKVKSNLSKLLLASTKQWCPKLQRNVGVLIGVSAKECFGKRLPNVMLKDCWICQWPKYLKKWSKKNN